jgi:protein-S-isoprenylcysteine O-methyltransferase Ste14
MESWGAVAQKIRVSAATLLGVVFLLLMHPSLRSLWLGGAIALTGAAIRIWAAGHIDKGKVLAQGGPYAWTRNPLYLGSFIMALGIILAGQAYWLLAPFGLFYLAVYFPVMKAEERELLQGHGEDFLAYARKVPLFFPGLHMSDESQSYFRWSRVVRNREHRTLAGLLLTEAFLILRTLS